MKKVDTNEPNMFAICWLSLLLVLALFRGFFSGFSGFLPSTMTNTSNSNLIRVEDPPAKAAVALASYADALRARHAIFRGILKFILFSFKRVHPNLMQVADRSLLWYDTFSSDFPIQNVSARAKIFPVSKSCYSWI